VESICSRQTDPGKLRGTKRKKEREEQTHLHINEVIKKEAALNAKKHCEKVL